MNLSAVPGLLGPLALEVRLAPSGEEVAAAVALSPEEEVPVMQLAPVRHVLQMASEASAKFQLTTSAKEEHLLCFQI